MMPQLIFCAEAYSLALANYYTGILGITDETHFKLTVLESTQNLYFKGVECRGL